jgi:hypothetical protein
MTPVKDIRSTASTAKRRDNCYRALKKRATVENWQNLRIFYLGHENHTKDFKYSEALMPESIQGGHSSSCRSIKGTT